MSDKTSAIRQMAKDKSETRQAEVLSAIKKMKAAGEKVTFYGVAKKTRASKSYLYGNETISTAINEARAAPQKPRSAESKDTIIKALRLKIRKLEGDAANQDSYKEKYEKLLDENKELKEQLRAAYQY